MGNVIGSSKAVEKKKSTDTRFRGYKSLDGGPLRHSSWVMNGDHMTFSLSVPEEALKQGLWSLQPEFRY